jgi:putative protein kinase ArgK-like GTPase of G3E family
MEMADTIVINKADGDNIRKNLRKQSSTERYIYFQQKSQVGFLQLQPAVRLHKTDSRSLGND